MKQFQSFVQVGECAMAKDQVRSKHQRDNSEGHNFPSSDSTITYGNVATTTFCWFSPCSSVGEDIVGD